MNAQGPQDMPEGPILSPHSPRTDHPRKRLAEECLFSHRGPPSVFSQPLARSARNLVPWAPSQTLQAVGAMSDQQAGCQTDIDFNLALSHFADEEIAPLLSVNNAAFFPETPQNDHFHPAYSRVNDAGVTIFRDSDLQISLDPAIVEEISRSTSAAFPTELDVPVVPPVFGPNRAIYMRSSDGPTEADWERAKPALYKLYAEAGVTLPTLIEAVKVLGVLERYVADL
jgi:hypothetical protein